MDHVHSIDFTLHLLNISTVAGNAYILSPKVTVAGNYQLSIEINRIMTLCVADSVT